MGLQSLSKLKILRLDFNVLTQLSSQHLVCCAQLRSLDLSSNRLTSLSVSTTLLSCCTFMYKFAHHHQLSHRLAVISMTNWLPLMLRYCCLGRLGFAKLTLVSSGMLSLCSLTHSYNTKVQFLGQGSQKLESKWDVRAGRNTDVIKCITMPQSL